jgi:hypothetical protein
VAALPANDVVFTSPVTFKPYPGKAITAAILRGVLRVFEDFTYIREIADPDGRDHAFVFTATVAGKQLQGCDFRHFDDDGKIDEFTVMVRPLSAARRSARPWAPSSSRSPERPPNSNHDDGLRRVVIGEGQRRTDRRRPPTLGLRTLLAERHNVPGGCATSFRIGSVPP